MPQIIQITSEALQATIRRLLPSQQGFGQDLQASNVITPVIDLTPTAEGSVLPSYLQTAFSFGALNNFIVSNTTTSLTTTPGFYRFFGSVYYRTFSTGSGTQARLFIDDGSGTEDVQRIDYLIGNSSTNYQSFDLNVFLRAGDTLKVTSPSVDVIWNVNVSQIADVKGNLVNPSGFTFE